MEDVLFYGSATCFGIAGVCLILLLKHLYKPPMKLILEQDEIKKAVIDYVSRTYSLQTEVEEFSNGDDILDDLDVELIVKGPVRNNAQ